jgi:hypothetical protein
MLKGSAGFLITIDPVWGGSYSSAFPEDMEAPGKFAALRAIPEKRILVQANAITAFALGYQHTNDSKFVEGINEIDRRPGRAGVEPNFCRKSRFEPNYRWSNTEYFGAILVVTL